MPFVHNRQEKVKLDYRDIHQVFNCDFVTFIRRICSGIMNNMEEIVIKERKVCMENR